MYDITQEYVGIAFIDSQGFGSECGVALARLCNQQKRPAFDYTGGYVPVYKAHLANLTDCDASGVAIGLKVSIILPNFHLLYLDNMIILFKVVLLILRVRVQSVTNSNSSKRGI